jgi:hypothetical protein
MTEVNTIQLTHVILKKIDNEINEVHNLFSHQPAEYMVLTHLIQTEKALS